MDEVLRRLAAIEWDFGVDTDVAAIAELKRRIAARARGARYLQDYTELVDGVVFRLAAVANGEPFEIREWTALNRQIIGNYLGRVAGDSYRAGGFLAAALVVRRDALQQPNDRFFELASEIGLLHSRSDDAKLRFWTEQVRLAVDWFNANLAVIW